MTDHKSNNTFGARAEIETASGKVILFRLEKLAEAGMANIETFPFSIRVLLESLLRNEDGHEVTCEDIERLASYRPDNPLVTELPFKPARVLLQDFTGVPALVDLAALRSAMARIGGDPEKINPLIPVDLVIDHSVQVDWAGRSDALEKNTAIEFERNRERYEFLHWGQKALSNFRAVPPASGICHQVNLEYLAEVVVKRGDSGSPVAFPDSLVGTDSHTTMINGLGVLGWGVGGIEAEAVMLGQPIYMLTPEVIGFKLIDCLPEGATATDLVLTATEMLRKKGVVGKFVEYFGPGLSSMNVTDRATLANMAPEYGATMGFFPVDDMTLDYLRYTGRSPELVNLVERYYKEQGMFRTDDSPDPVYKDTLELDLSTVVPSLAGPKRPQDRIPVNNLKNSLRASLTAPMENQGFALGEERLNAQAQVEYPQGSRFELTHGDVVITAITSCTNTSNPSVLIAAGLLAKKAVEAGLKVNPQVKTSFAPGSKVVTDYLVETGLLPYLEKLGFHIVGYGCTTCIGNSGPLPDPIVDAIKAENLVVASVLSGNRNFTGRISPHAKATYLASPPLVVAYALAGTVDIDLTSEPIGKGQDGQDIYLRDVMPSTREIAEHLPRARNPETFRREYKGIEQSNEVWNRIEGKDGAVYNWDETSTYIQEPPFFLDMDPVPEPIKPIVNARVLVKAGISVTTDHISPAGVIPPDGPAGQYLISHGVEPVDFNSFGSRRGNDRVMTRGTFANVMFRNQLTDRDGGWTIYHPTGELTTIFDASVRYRADNVPLIVLAGDDYGMGSSRDWAAKGTLLLGIKVVIAQSFERIHRSNLVGMGVLPLQFKEGESADMLKLSGDEIFTIHVDDSVKPLQEITVNAIGGNGSQKSFNVVCRMDTPIEVDYYRNGGILHTVLRRLFKE